MSRVLRNTYAKYVKNVEAHEPSPSDPPARIEKLDQRIVVVIDKERRAGDEQEVLWTVEELCSKCRGKGGSPRSKKVQCRVCKGLGYLHIQRGASFRWKKTCDQCHGQGFEVEEACVECQAYGKLAKLHRRKFKIPKNLESPESFDGLGHFSFDGKSRGRLIIQWTRKI